MTNMYGRAPILSGIVVISSYTCKHDYMKLIRAARLRFKRFFRLWAMLLWMAAAATWMLMVRMNVLTWKTAGYSSDICLSAPAARMYIKAYDTQWVPYYQQNSRKACENIPHTNLQRYKFPRNKNHTSGINAPFNTENDTPRAWFARNTSEVCTGTRWI